MPMQLKLVPYGESNQEVKPFSIKLVPEEQIQSTSNEQIVQRPVPKVVQRPVPKASSAEKIAANPLTRVGLGLSSYGPALMQIGENIGDFIADKTGITGSLGGNKFMPAPAGEGYKANADYVEHGPKAFSFNENIKRLEEMKNRGMASDMGVPEGQQGFDWYGLAGAMANPAGLQYIKSLPKAKGLLDATWQGMKTGGLFGALTPVTDASSTEDFVTSKGIQTGGGLALGGAIPGSAGLIGKTGSWLDDVALPFRKGGAEMISQRHLRGIVGEEGIPSVVKSLRGSGGVPGLTHNQELVKGSKPVAADLLFENPYGSPLIAQQISTAGTTGGPSALFGQRIKDRMASHVAAKAERDAITSPMRETALSAANVNGVKSQQIIDKIDGLLNDPNYKGITYVERSLNMVKNKIGKYTDDAGNIDSRILYNIRSTDASKMIARALGTTKTKSDQRLTAGLLSDVNKGIDDAIESSGGTGWKDYLSEYAQRSQALSTDFNRSRLSLKPLQKSRLRKGVDVASETTTLLPPMLSTPVVIGNHILRILKGKDSGIEREVDDLMARQFLNPDELASVLEIIPKSKRSVVIKSYMKNAPSAIAGASVGQSQ